MKIGKTIVAEREKAVSESERMEFRARQKRKQKLSVATFAMVIVFVIVLISAVVYNFTKSRELEKNSGPVAPKYIPTVTIIDESGSNYITDRIKTYVAKIEKDFFDLGYKVEKAVIPVDRAREVDIYIEDRPEYYKCSLDRGTAESAEAAEIMIRYLRDHEITAQYVDIRIEGKAYYR